MADEVKRVEYYYTEVPDKPGEGLKVLNALKEEGVNLDALVAFLKGDARNSILYPWIRRHSRQQPGKPR